MESVLTGLRHLLYFMTQIRHICVSLAVCRWHSVDLCVALGCDCDVEIASSYLSGCSLPGDSALHTVGAQETVAVWLPDFTGESVSITQPLRECLAYFCLSSFQE